MSKMLILLILPLGLFAQEKHDYNWMLGYGTNSPQNLFGGTQISFNSDPIEVSFFNVPFYLFSHAGMSDKDGNLLFYSNGCQVANREHQIMPNGDGINPGPTHDSNCKSGYPTWQGNLMLPWPASDNKYFYFHMRKSGDAIKDDLLYSVIDMDLAGGMGDVGAIKNQQVIDDSLSDILTAVRHGNGRDWWVLVPKNYHGGNSYYRLLLNPNGISGPYVQPPVGENQSYKDWSGQAAFSPDGSWYARANPHNELHLFRFDRCTGLLSQPRKLTLPDPDLYACGVAFSPNSQRLYVTTGLMLFQYDLTKPNVEATRVLVGEYDGFDVTGFATTFFQMMLAPNGKIYMTGTSGVNVMHTIHNPDALGLACDFRQHDLVLPARIMWQVPNFPHFRLYDLSGSPCDTLGINGSVATGESEREKEMQVVLWPNPAQESCTVELSGGEGIREGRWALYGSTGQEILAGVWPAGQRTFRLDFSGQARGVYAFVIWAGSGQVVVKELIVM
jgi:hypothetical protein